MKKTILLILCLCTLSFNASAQWFLFPGKGKKDSRTKEGGAPQVMVGDRNAADSTKTEETNPEDIQDKYEYEEFGTVRLALLLPFQTGSKPSSNFLDMYNGALLAVRDAAENGMRVNLSVYDCAEMNAASMAGIVNANDLTIGPVSTEQLKDLLLVCDEDKFIVSPLEPKAIGLTDELRLIQFPSSWTLQYDRLVECINGISDPFEYPIMESRLTVLKDPSGCGEQGTYLLDRLDKAGISYSVKEKYDELEVRDGCWMKYVIASDNDEYISGAVRALGLLAGTENREKCRISLYGTSRTKSAASDILTLHKLDSRIVLGYYTDYGNGKVKDFIRKYRAVFYDEPGSFAFQGYDLLHCMLKVCGRYGKQWHKTITLFSESGLQSDFRFENEGGKGFVNTGTRMVHFYPDLTTTHPLATPAQWTTDDY